MPVSTANRGKYAEKKVKDILTDFEARNIGFTFNRCLDAHAAGGRFPAQAGDFQAFVKGTYNVTQSEKGVHLLWSTHQDGAPASRNFIIEAKEVNHAFRLPHKNYSPDGVGRVLKRVWAGTEAVVVVLHKVPCFVWRIVPFDVFTKREGGSWDLSTQPAYDNLMALEKALAQWMGVK